MRPRTAGGVWAANQNRAAALDVIGVDVFALTLMSHRGYIWPRRPLSPLQHLPKIHTHVHTHTHTHTRMGNEDFRAAVMVLFPFIKTSACKTIIYDHNPLAQCYWINHHRLNTLKGWQRRGGKRL